jgi:hypothetical protein
MACQSPMLRDVMDRERATKVLRLDRVILARALGIVASPLALQRPLPLHCPALSFDLAQCSHSHVAGVVGPGAATAVGTSISRVLQDLDLAGTVSRAPDYVMRPRIEKRSHRQQQVATHADST